MKIAVLIVTYNRISCLKQAISRYEKQTLHPEVIIVVNNASSDGTFEYLEGWKNSTDYTKKVVIHNKSNLGGAGGFSIGIEESLNYEFDYLFLADDDAYARSDTFEILFSYNDLINDSNTVAICTTVINHGIIDLSHRCRVKKGKLFIGLKWVKEDEYRNDFYKLDVATFVGVAIKKSTIERVGFPLKEYFIYYDDTEYFFRIKKLGNIYCITRSLMIHDTDERQSINSWKGYYDTRNWIDAVGKHYKERYKYYVIVSSYIRRCSVLALLFRGRNNRFRLMSKEAIIDARNSKLGINEKYTPDRRLKKENG